MSVTWIARRSLPTDLTLPLAAVFMVAIGYGVALPVLSAEGGEP